MNDKITSAAIEYMAARKDANLARLFEWLRIPSISTQIQHGQDCRNAASWLLEQLQAAGFSTALIETISANHPLVYAEWLGAKGAPTVLLYGHYDVQPTESDIPWISEPFSPVIDGDVIRARGVSDDKGQVFMNLVALESFLATSGALPVNVKILIEGQEESGGEGLKAFLADSSNHSRLKADFLMVSDTRMPNSETPCICRGLRGIVYFDQVTIFGPKGNLHSGMCGGAANNPLIAQAHLISRLKSPDGRILIPGFYDKVREIDSAEEALLAAFPMTEDAFTANSGEPIWGEREYSLQARLGARPTLDLHGQWGGYAGAGSMTMIPPSASFKVSTRLVPDQEPEEIAAMVRSFIEEQAANLGVRCEIKEHHSAMPLLVDVNSAPIRAAARALEAVWGTPAVFERSGGSIPAVELFKTNLGLNPVLIGFGLPTDGIHAANECFNLGNYHRGTEALIHTFCEFANIS